MSQPTKGLQYDEPFKRVQDVIRARLVDILGTMGVENPEISFEIPPDTKFGDLSSPTCMGLARVLKQSPRQIATSIKEEFDRDIPSLVYKLEIAPPGYLNFFLEWDSYITLTREAIIARGKKFGEIDDGAGKKVIVEHTSANPNKPIHLGTARCAVLGDVAGRVLAMGGYTVEIDNYIDDLGRQVAVMLHGYRHFKDTIDREAGQKDDYFLGLVYVAGASDIADKDDGNNIVRDLLHEMERGGSPENILAKELVDKALKGQLQTLWRMNIFYNLLIWERHIVSSGLFNSAISSMQDKNPDACYKIESGDDEGCVVLDMSMFGEKYTQNKKPYKILTRSNGVSTYTGKDIAFQLWKFGEASGFFTYEEFVKQPNGKFLHSTNLPAEDAGEKRKEPKAGGENQTGEENDFGHADRAINVIGFEQKYPQQVVRSALKVLGYDHHYDNSAHLSFKHVWLPDQKFSGRKGTWIGFHADAAMDKAVKKARAIIKGQNPDLSAENHDSLAEIIGVGAIKFYLAKFDLEKEITINWDDLLNFEGDACPYVQYSCVRAGSILEKARERGIPIPPVDAIIDASMLDTPQERALYFIISQFPSKIREICQSLSINQAPLYALEVADKFNSFYHECPVLRDDVPDDLQVARLMLVQDTILVLKTLLERVLGIQVPVRM